jgi:hypothetical protein
MLLPGLNTGSSAPTPSHTSSRLKVHIAGAVFDRAAPDAGAERDSATIRAVPGRPAVD